MTPDEAETKEIAREAQLLLSSLLVKAAGDVEKELSSRLKSNATTLMDGKLTIGARHYFDAHEAVLEEALRQLRPWLAQVTQDYWDAHWQYANRVRLSRREEGTA